MQRSLSRIELLLRTKCRLCLVQPRMIWTIQQKPRTWDFDEDTGDVTWDFCSVIQEAKNLDHLSMMAIDVVQNLDIYPYDVESDCSKYDEFPTYCPSISTKDDYGASRFDDEGCSTTKMLDESVTRRK